MTLKIKSLFFSALTIILLTSCGNMFGDEIARLPINEISTGGDNLIIKEVTLDLEKDDNISFWSELDFSFEGNAESLFKVRIFKGEEEIDFLEFDPTKKNISLNEVKTSINGKTKWKFTGKNASYIIKEKGSYTFKSIFVTDNPTLQLNKAELVLKK